MFENEKNKEDFLDQKEALKKNMLNLVDKSIPELRFKIRNAIKINNIERFVDLHHPDVLDNRTKIKKFNKVHNKNINYYIDKKEENDIFTEKYNEYTTIKKRKEEKAKDGEPTSNEIIFKDLLKIYKDKGYQIDTNLDKNIFKASSLLMENNKISDFLHFSDKKDIYDGEMNYLSKLNTVMEIRLKYFNEMKRGRKLRSVDVNDDKRNSSIVDILMEKRKIKTNEDEVNRYKKMIKNDVMGYADDVENMKLSVFGIEMDYYKKLAKSNNSNNSFFAYSSHKINSSNSKIMGNTVSSSKVNTNTNNNSSTKNVSNKTFFGKVELNNTSDSKMKDRRKSHFMLHSSAGENSNSEVNFKDDTNKKQSNDNKGIILSISSSKLNNNTNIFYKKINNANNFISKNNTNNTNNLSSFDINKNNKAINKNTGALLKSKTSAFTSTNNRILMNNTAYVSNNVNRIINNKNLFNIKNDKNNTGHIDKNSSVKSILNSTNYDTRYKFGNFNKNNSSMKSTHYVNFASGNNTKYSSNNFIKSNTSLYNVANTNNTHIPNNSNKLNSTFFNNLRSNSVIFNSDLINNSPSNLDNNSKSNLNNFSLGKNNNPNVNNKIVILDNIKEKDSSRLSYDNSMSSSSRLKILNKNNISNNNLNTNQSKQSMFLKQSTASAYGSNGNIKTNKNIKDSFISNENSVTHLMLDKTKTKSSIFGFLKKDTINNTVDNNSSLNVSTNNMENNSNNKNNNDTNNKNINDSILSQKFKISLVNLNNNTKNSNLNSNTNKDSSGARNNSYFSSILKNNINNMDSTISPIKKKKSPSITSKDRDGRDSVRNNNKNNSIAENKDKDNKDSITSSPKKGKLFKKLFKFTKKKQEDIRRVKNNNTFVGLFNKISFGDINERDLEIHNIYEKLKLKQYDSKELDEEIYNYLKKYIPDDHDSIINK